jgi:hypothetical protein
MWLRSRIGIAGMSFFGKPVFQVTRSPTKPTSKFTYHDALSLLRTFRASRDEIFLRLASENFNGDWE